MGDLGVVDVMLPIAISAKPLTSIEAGNYLKKAVSTKAKEEEEEEEERTDATDDLDAYDPATMRIALQLMDGKSDKAFQKAAVKEEEVEDILDDIVNGSFQELMMEAGYVEKDADGDYEVVKLPAAD